MARRRLTPAQPGYLGSTAQPALEAKSMPVASAVAPPIAKVSGQSAEAAALRELAEGIEEARRDGRMIVDIPLGDIAPGHLIRDRLALDREELNALKASIQVYGQRTPAEITPLDESDEDGTSPYRFGLISGWRRLRALTELHDETGELRFSTLRALIRPAGEASAAYVAMIEENEIRVELSYYERARVVAEATARGVFPDQSEALRTLFATASRAKRSKIGSFIEIHEALGDLLLFPAEIPERLGLALVARLKAGEKDHIRRELGARRSKSATSELDLLTRLSRAPRPDVSRAKQASEVLRDGLALTAKRKGDKIVLTLSGQAVDDALFDEVRTALRKLV